MNKWYSTFVSNAGVRYRVEIEDSTLSADRAFTMAAQPVQLRFEQGDNKYTPIRSQSCTINVADSQDMSTIYSQLWDRKLTVTRIADSYKMFDGWVVPSQWQQPFTSGVNRFTIEAQDGLGLLAHKKYAQIDENGRKVLYFNTFMQRCAGIIGAQVEWNICQLSGSSLKREETAFSEDLMLPADYFTPNTDDEWPHYSKGIEMICSFLGAFAYIENGKLIISEYENTSIYWVKNSEADLTADPLVEVVPAVSKIVFSPNKENVLFLNDVFSIDRHKDNSTGKWGGKTFANTYYNNEGDYTSKFAVPYDSRDCDPQSVQFYTRYKNTEHQKAVDETPVLKDSFEFYGKAQHAVPCQVNLTVTAKKFRGTLKPVPVDTDKSIVSNDDNLICVSTNNNGVATTINPSTVTFEYKSDDTGFIEIKYVFSGVPAGRISLKGNTKTPVFFKDIEVMQDYEKDDETETISEAYDNVMSVSLDMWWTYDQSGQLFSNYSHAVYNGVFLWALQYADDTSKYYMSFLQPKLSKQYSKCRKAYTTTKTITGFSIGKLARYNSKECTIEAATLDLQYDTVSAVLLESYTND